MNHIKQYVKQNKKQLHQMFSTMGSDNMIEATKIYSFLQSAFDTQEIKLIKKGASIFISEQNQQKMERLIEKYYLTKNPTQTKFYMYRITFQFSQVVDILKFWLTSDPQIQVIYKGQVSQTQSSIEGKIENITNNQVQIAKFPQKEEESQKEDNEFMPDIKEIPEIIKAYKDEILKYQERIQTQPLNQNQIKILRDKIQELQTKIHFLQQRLKKHQQKQRLKRNKTQLSNQNHSNKLQIAEESASTSPKKMSLSPTKIDAIMKAIFEFYAKQLHVTGVKASFERIEHESSRVNYQKLVHFLKEYNIFPSQSKDQKKLHQFYVKSSSNTRDLTYQGFLNLLQKLAQIVISSQNESSNKFELLKMKIIEQRRKSKVLNNPFHSLEKEDFRIDKSSLRYEFKLMPLNGKDPDQIVSELQARKQIKQQKKQQKEQQQMNKKIRYIKKLESIDPFHPLVQKNKHLIREKSVMQSEPIVSMDNIEMFRDKSFDLKMLGIQSDIHGQKNESPSHKGSLLANNSYLIKNRARQIQKLELDKMNSLMSGIIERSNAKLQRMGISPTKKSSLH